MALLELREAGICCREGDFYIDPWQPVDRAILTHGHADRVRPGCRAYLTSHSGQGLVRELVGPEAPLEGIEYGVPVEWNGVRVSLHPAGHILGSAQVRIERGGEVWVVAGDFKVAADPTCARFEPLRCHTFVTGAIFGLPIFRWPSDDAVVDGIQSWWRANREAGKTSVLFADPVGDTQRLLARLEGPVQVPEAVERVNAIYREQGVPLPASSNEKGALLLRPPGDETGWKGPASKARASGWMRIRGTRRRQSLDRGFVFSNHADWPSLLSVIDETRAETVWVTHGYRGPLVRWLDEHGRRGVAVDTPFGEGGS